MTPHVQTLIVLIKHILQYSPFNTITHITQAPFVDFFQDHLKYVELNPMVYQYLSIELFQDHVNLTSFKTITCII